MKTKTLPDIEKEYLMAEPVESALIDRYTSQGIRFGTISMTKAKWLVNGMCNILGINPPLICKAEHDDIYEAEYTGVEVKAILIHDRKIKATAILHELSHHLCESDRVYLNRPEIHKPTGEIIVHHGTGFLKSIARIYEVFSLLTGGGTTND